jgi:XTP/dITP diphosphohydrolase
MDVVLATKNRKKIEEMKMILGVMGTAPRVYTLDDFPAYQEVKEDGNTFEENAVKKAVYIYQSTGMTAIADDSGLEVEVLNKAPGVLSARYAGEFSDDRRNIEKLLEEMRGVPLNKRNSRFVCCIALACPDEVKTFNGYIQGTITREPRGEKGFGYDPVFIPEGHVRTFAEMDENEKNAISHRSMALKELQKYLLEKRGYGGGL